MIVRKTGKLANVKKEKTYEISEIHKRSIYNEKYSKVHVFSETISKTKDCKKP